MTIAREAAHAVVGTTATGSRGDEADGEENESDNAEDDEARHRPVRDLRSQQHPGDEDRHREQVEEPMCEHRSEERRARALAVGEVPAEDCDARELAGPGGKHGVTEEADPERREDMAEPRMRWRQRLVDREPPGERAGENREQVEEDADDHPAPGDEIEGVVDGRPLRAAPPDRDDRGGERGEDEETAGPGIAAECDEPIHAAETRASAIARS